MWPRAALAVSGGLLCLTAATAALGAHPGPAPLPAGPALAPRAHGFMLYLSKPLGGGTGAAALQPKFGFRIDQVRMMGNSGAPDAGDPMQRRTLIGWQFNGRSGLHPSDMRLELGGRVSYDVTHGGFVIQSGHSGASQARTLGVATTPGHPPALSGEPNAFALRGPGVPVRGDGARPFTGELFREGSGSTSLLHDVASAAIATFKSSRSLSPQQRSRPRERPYAIQESR